MGSNTPSIIKRFVKATSNLPDFEDVSSSIDCMMNIVGEARGPTSPGSPDLSALSEASHLSASTLASQDSDEIMALPYAVSAQERTWYYYGVTRAGDQPELLYRTSWEKEPWEAPTGRFAFPPLKFARPVYKTPLNEIWDTVGPLVNDLVSAAVSKSYSINTARFLTVPNGEGIKEGTLGPAVIWISVYPDSTSTDVAHEVSQQILRLLADNGVEGVDIEWSEGVMSRLAALLPNVEEDDITAHFRRHLTTTLSIPIAAAKMAKTDGQGSGGLYFHEGLDKNGNPSDKVLLVTNHHVVCEEDDKTYDFRANGSPCQKVRVCGSRRFQQGLDEIKAEISRYFERISASFKSIAKLEARMESGDGGENAVKSLEKAHTKLANHEAAIAVLKEFYREIDVSWSNIAHRDIGVLEYSPPISTDINNDSERYTQDWATIRLDPVKFRRHFTGNVIDLGSRLPPGKFTELMHPQADTKPAVEYPTDGLLRVRGFVTKEQLENPQSIDIDRKPYLIVLKDGSASDLTFGRCAGLKSYIRGENGAESTEVAVFNYDEDQEMSTFPFAFSSPGDSGSLIVNGKGEMVGLLHSGESKIRGSGAFITYATPAWRLCKWIKEIYPNADFTRETW